jgi:hypothetical protein
MHVIPFQGVHEGFRDPIALRALHRREAGFQAEPAGEDAGLPGGVIPAVIDGDLCRPRDAIRGT